MIMTAKETLELLSKQQATLEDIIKICNVGRNKALEIRTNIKQSLIKQGYIVSNNLIPMSELIKAFHIDIDYLEKMSNK